MKADLKYRNNSDDHTADHAQRMVRAHSGAAPVTSGLSKDWTWRRDRRFSAASEIAPRIPTPTTAIDFRLIFAYYPAYADSGALDWYSAFYPVLVRSIIIGLGLGRAR